VETPFYSREECCLALATILSKVSHGITRKDVFDEVRMLLQHLGGLGRQRRQRNQGRRFLIEGFRPNMFGRRVKRSSFITL